MESLNLTKRKPGTITEFRELKVGSYQRMSIWLPTQLKIIGTNASQNSTYLSVLVTDKNIRVLTICAESFCFQFRGQQLSALVMLSVIRHILYLLTKKVQSRLKVGG